MKKGKKTKSSFLHEIFRGFARKKMKFTFRSIRKSCFEVKFRWISIIQGSQTIWKTNLTAKNFCDEFLPNAAANENCRITKVIPSDPFHWELISTCLFRTKPIFFPPDLYFLLLSLYCGVIAGHYYSTNYVVCCTEKLK